MKLLIPVMCMLMSFMSYAGERPLSSRQVVEKFFDNYRLIGDWKKFEHEQSKILAPNLVTRTSDHRGKKSFYGRKGFFDSLGDWSRHFSTGQDFRIKIIDASPRRVVVRLYGTLNLVRPINGYSHINNDQHEWTEIFTVGPKGIVKLEVLMNLFK